MHATSIFPAVNLSGHIKANAIVHCRGRFQCAKVYYSAGGLQLEGTISLIKTDTIQFEFISGRRVFARVVRPLGAQMAEPQGHPALIELPRRTNNQASSTGPQTSTPCWLAPSQVQNTPLYITRSRTK